MREDDKDVRADEGKKSMAEGRSTMEGTREMQYV